jgi:hypothetical protein
MPASPAVLWGARPRSCGAAPRRVQRAATSQLPLRAARWQRRAAQRTVDLMPARSARGPASRASRLDAAPPAEATRAVDRRASSFHPELRRSRARVGVLRRVHIDDGVGAAARRVAVQGPHDRVGDVVDVGEWQQVAAPRHQHAQRPDRHGTPRQRRALTGAVEQPGPDDRDRRPGGDRRHGRLVGKQLGASVETALAAAVVIRAVLVHDRVVGRHSVDAQRAGADDAVHAGGLRRLDDRQVALTLVASNSSQSPGGDTCAGVTRRRRPDRAPRASASRGRPRSARRRPSPARGGSRRGRASRRRAAVRRWRRREIRRHR